MHVFLCSKSRCILHNGDDPSVCNDCSNGGASCNDIRSSSASSMGAMGSSKQGSSPSTRMNAIQHIRGGK